MKNLTPKQVPVFTFAQLEKLGPEQIELRVSRNTAEPLFQAIPVPESPFGGEYWPVFKKGKWRWVNGPGALNLGTSSNS